MNKKHMMRLLMVTTIAVVLIIALLPKSKSYASEIKLGEIELSSILYDRGTEIISSAPAQNFGEYDIGSGYQNVLRVELRDANGNVVKNVPHTSGTKYDIGTINYGSTVRVVSKDPAEINEGYFEWFRDPNKYVWMYDLDGTRTYRDTRWTIYDRPPPDAKEATSVNDQNGTHLTGTGAVAWAKREGTITTTPIMQIDGTTDVVPFNVISGLTFSKTDFEVKPGRSLSTSDVLDIETQALDPATLYYKFLFKANYDFEYDDVTRDDSNGRVVRYYNSWQIGIEGYVYKYQKLYLWVVHGNAPSPSPGDNSSSPTPTPTPSATPTPAETITGDFTIEKPTMTVRESNRITPIGVSVSGGNGSSLKEFTFTATQGTNSKVVFSSNANSQDYLYQAPFPTGFGVGTVQMTMKITSTSGASKTVGPKSFNVIPDPMNGPPTLKVAWVKSSSSTKAVEDAFIGDKLYFKILNVSDPDGDTVTTTWEIENGDSWIQGLPAKYGWDAPYTKKWYGPITMDEDGTEEVCAKAVDEWGEETTDCASVDVDSPNPIPKITGPDIVKEGHILEPLLSSEKSYTKVPGRTIDHSRDIWTDKKDSYDVVGTEEVRLEVFDNVGLKSLRPDFHTITVIPDQPPVPDFEYNSTMVRNRPYSLQNLSRSDDGDQIETYQVSWGYDASNDGNVDPTANVISTSSDKFEFNPPLVGRYCFRVYVKEVDYNGHTGKSAYKDYTVDVINDNPEATFTVSGVFPDPKPPRIVKYANADFLTQSWSMSKGRGKGNWFLSREGNLMSPPIWNTLSENKGSYYTVRSDSQLTYKGQLPKSEYIEYYGRMGNSNVFLGKSSDSMGNGNAFIQVLGGEKKDLTGTAYATQVVVREDLGEVLVYHDYDLKTKDYYYEATGSRFLISDLAVGKINPTNFTYKVDREYYHSEYHTTVSGSVPSFSDGTSPLNSGYNFGFIRFKEDFKRIDATNRKIYSHKLESLGTPYSVVDYDQLASQPVDPNKYDERYPNSPIMMGLNIRDNDYNYYTYEKVGSDSTPPFFNYANDIKSYYQLVRFDGSTGIPQRFGDIVATSKGYEMYNGITNPSYFKGINRDGTLLKVETYVFKKIESDSEDSWPVYDKVDKYLDTKTGQLLDSIPTGRSTVFSLTPNTTFSEDKPVSDGYAIALDYHEPSYCTYWDSNDDCVSYKKSETYYVADINTKTLIREITDKNSPLIQGSMHQSSGNYYPRDSFVSMIFDGGQFKSYAGFDDYSSKLPNDEKYVITPDGKVYDITQDQTPSPYSTDAFSLGNWINPQSERFSSGTIRWSQKFNTLPLNGLSAGFNFRIVDEDNMYRLELDKQKIKLSKIAGGIKTILAEAIANHTTSRWYNYQIKINDNKIRVYEDGAPALPEVTDTEFTEGTLGPFALVENVEFKDISLQLSGYASEYEAQGYALVDAQTRYTTNYSDPENDPAFEAGTQWVYTHTDPNMFLDYKDGKSGLSALHGQTRTSPNLVFDRVGLFKITYRVPDDPHPNHLQRDGDMLFSSYSKYSDDYSRSLVVHRRPISLFTLSPNGDGTIAWNDQSYDPDRCYNAGSCQSGYQTNHGIMAKEYYYLTPSGTQVNGMLVRPPESGTYTVGMKVEDFQFAKSDWYEQTITVDKPLTNGPPSATLTYPNGTQANPTLLDNERPTIKWSQSDPESGTIFELVNILIKDEAGNVMIQRNGMVQHTTSTTNQWTLDQDLPLGTKFQVQVQVTDGDLTSAWSNIGWMKTNSTPAAALTFPNGTRNAPSIATTSTPEIRWNQYDPDAGTVFMSADVWIQDDSDQTFILRNVPMNTTEGSWQWTIDQAMTPGSLHQVKVRVYDQLGAVSPWSNIGWIRVNNPPAVVMTYPTGTYDNPTMGNPTPLITWTQTDPDPNTTFTKYRLLVRDESATVSYVDTAVEVNTQSSTGSYQVMEPLPAGIKVRVTVMVWDQYVNSPWAEETWMLTNRPPTADFDWSPKPVWEGDTVHLINQSVDPDRDMLSYVWEVTAPDGTTVSYDTADVTAGFLLAGPYTVKLTATDGFATSQVTKVITAQPLTIQSDVEHIPEWLANHQRLIHNTTVRPIDFYSGEIFVVHTRSSPAPVLKAEAWIDTIGLDGNELNINTELAQSGDDSTFFTGEIFDDRLLSLTEGLPKGNQTVHFRITYSNGVIKEEDVPVTIIGNVREFVQVHRVR